MSSYESSSLTEIEAVLDGLEEATSQEVYDATRGYSPKALAAVAASRADAAGGGGGGGAEFPDEWTVGADGSLVIAPSGPTSTPLVLRGSASGSTLLGITDSTGDVQLYRFSNDPFLSVSDENGYGAVLGATALGGTYILPPPELTDPIFKVFDNAGNGAFQINADGTVHIKSGGTVVADL